MHKLKTENFTSFPREFWLIPDFWSVVYEL